MGKRRIDLLIAVLVMVAAIGSLRYFAPDFLNHRQRVQQMLTQPSVIAIDFTITNPPQSAVLIERWRLRDIDGHSTTIHELQTRTLLRKMVYPDRQSTAIPALYDALGAPEIRQLADVGKNCATAVPGQACYLLAVQTSAFGKSHRRTLSFFTADTRPTAAREFHIMLDERRSITAQLPAFVQLVATPGPAVGYRKILAAFRAYAATLNPTDR